MRETALKSPDLSIFIVSYNTSDLLRQCLSSIFDCCRCLSCEVFVIDSGSDNGSTDMVKSEFPQVKLIVNTENKGYTKSINQVLPLASGDYFLLMHPDVKLLPSSLDRMVGFLQSHENAGIVGGNLLYPDGTANICKCVFPSIDHELLRIGLRILRKLFSKRDMLENMEKWNWDHQATREVDYVWSACLMVKRKVVEQIGTLDEDLFVWFSNNDWCMRAKKVGWEVYYLYNAKVIHYERQSFDSPLLADDKVSYKITSWPLEDKLQRDRYLFLKKHYGLSSLLVFKFLGIIEFLFRLISLWVFKLLGLKKKPEVDTHKAMCIKIINMILKT